MTVRTIHRPDLGLAPGVFLAVSDGFGIFLDLARDAYSAVELGQPAGDQLLAIGEDDAELTARLAPHVETLLAEGLLIEGGTRPGAFRRISPGSGQLFARDDRRPFGLAENDGAGVRVGVRDVIAVYFACRRASRALRTESIADTVSRVKTRNAGFVMAGRSDELFERVEVFHRVRPLYDRAYLCIFETLALVEYLAMHRCAVDWIFGVQLQPFGAHCWAAFDGLLLNESVEYSRQFTPIMQV